MPMPFNYLNLYIMCIVFAFVAWTVIIKSFGEITPRQAYLVAEKSCWPKILFSTRKTRPWDSKRDANKDNNFGMTYPNQTNMTCPGLDFLASIDPSIRYLDANAICDNFAKEADILCRLYLRQIGLESLEHVACKLNNTRKVPKIVYFIVFGEYEFCIWHYIAYVGAHRHIQPTAMYLIGDQHPQGPYWELIQRDVPGIRYVYRPKPQKISGMKIRSSHHCADIVRLQIMYLNGGIYLDNDMVVFRSLDPLLDHELTMGLLTNASGLGNAFILTKRGNSFIEEWYGKYIDYKYDEWYYNSMQVSRDMYYKNTNRINNIRSLIYKPNWNEIHLMINESISFDWQQSYAMHVWVNSKQIPSDISLIKKNNATIGRMFRYILYGDPAIRSD